MCGSVLCLIPGCTLLGSPFLGQNILPAEGTMQEPTEQRLLGLLLGRGLEVESVSFTLAQ